MTQEPAPRTIVIAGGGSAGWMTAAACAHLLPAHLYRVVLVESDAIGTVGVGEATIPQIRNFNQALGLDEDAFLRATGGTFKLGIEFVGWGAPGERYLHAFGDVGRDSALHAFHHLWLRARAGGDVRPLGDYALNDLAARAARMQRGAARTARVLPDMPYAFHFDAALYARMLRRFAEARGVIRHEGRIVRVERDGHGGDVTALLLEGERRIAGDLFVDATGFRSLLLGEALGVGFEDWTRWLPCDRALAVPSSRTAPLLPYTRATAHEAGWQWRIPLQHRTGNGVVYSSAHWSDEAAADHLMSHLDGAAEGDPRPIRFTTGKRARMWAHNVVAVGLAAGFMEPLESTSLWLVQSGLARLLAMFPDRDFDSATTARYNRILTTEFEEIRDFLILHYHATQRRDTPFWRYCADMAVPDRLIEKMRVYAAHGRVFRENEELFNDTSWFAVMHGQLLPVRTHDPVADAMDLATTRARLAEIERAVANSAAYMPGHRDFVNRHCRAAS